MEDETARRIEFLVKKRVEEELEKRKDEIEAEVSRRVEAAKQQMERELMLELEKRREEARLEEQKREVNIFDVDVQLFPIFLIAFWFSVSSFSFRSISLYTYIYIEFTGESEKLI